jgi:tetratricopeptide (TPR) repeat protein
VSIFISYRRADTDSAVLFYSWLRERFGPEQVFWDRENIPPGARWVDVLNDRLRQSTALVVLIGSDWMAMTDEAGRRRLDDPQDWVRREIATALELKLLVLQVLMGDATTPRAEQLPADLRELANLQVLRISDLRIREQLIGALDSVVKTAPAPAANGNQPARRIQRLLARQVGRLQIRAVELIQEHKVDRAVDELREGSQLLSELLLVLLELSPGDVQLDAPLGYLYGTLAQSFEAAGARQMADRYVELATTVFQRALENPLEGNVAEIASALNGLAALLSRRGQYDEAIKLYKRVVATLPNYAYAWHDLFAALDLRARQGRIDVDLMAEAVEQVRATGLGQPGLSASHVEDLQRRVLHWASVAHDHPERVEPAGAAQPGATQTLEKRHRSRGGQ